MQMTMNFLQNSALCNLAGLASRALGLQAAASVSPAISGFDIEAPFAGFEVNSAYIYGIGLIYFDV